MRLLIVLICLNMLACSYSTKPLNNSNDSKVENSIPEECIDENGEFNEDLGTDTLDCGNLAK